MDLPGLGTPCFRGNCPPPQPELQLLRGQLQLEPVGGAESAGNSAHFQHQGRPCWAAPSWVVAGGRCSVEARFVPGSGVWEPGVGKVAALGEPSEGRDMQSGRSPSKEGTGPTRRLLGMAWPRGGVMHGLDKKGLSVADRPIFAPNPDDSGSGGEAGSASHEDRGQNEATESTSPWGGRMLTRMPALGTLSEVRPGPRGRWGGQSAGGAGPEDQAEAGTQGHPKLDVRPRVGCRELPSVVAGGRGQSRGEGQPV